MHPRSIPLFVGIAVSVAVPPLLAQDSDALTRGMQLYAAQCARCHGVDGGGGEGPSLVGRQFARAQDDRGLVRIIRGGINGTAMPGAGWLGNDEAQLIADYVWTLARVEAEPVPGDPDAGWGLFHGKGECSDCHIVNGEGSGLGPELSDIGARRDVRYLRRSMLNPGAVLPRGELGPHSNFLIVRVDMNDGRTLRGMRVTEDAFVILLREREGAYLTLMKSDVAELEREFGASFMPDYDELLTEDEVMDLVAYMASLRGAR